MTNATPTPAELAALKADLQNMTGPELVHAALTDPRLDWLDTPELTPYEEWEYRESQRDE